MGTFWGASASPRGSTGTGGHSQNKHQNTKTATRTAKNTAKRHKNTENSRTDDGDKFSQTNESEKTLLYYYNIIKLIFL